MILYHILFYSILLYILILFLYTILYYTIRRTFQSGSRSWDPLGYGAASQQLAGRADQLARDDDVGRRDELVAAVRLDKRVRYGMV